MKDPQETNKKIAERLEYFNKQKDLDNELPNRKDPERKGKVETTNYNSGIDAYSSDDMDTNH